MTRNIYILFFVFWFALGNSLVAQTNWNLNRCISYAIENNNGLKQTEIQEKLVSEDLNQSKRNLLPGLSASSQAGLNFGRSIDPATNGISNTKFFNNSYAIGASVILFDGFKSVSYTHLRAHETRHDLVCRLLLETK